MHDPEILDAQAKKEYRRRRAPVAAQPERHRAIAPPICQQVRRPANSMSMNRRHAAALALVGWYLIAPPIRRIEPELEVYDEYDYDYLDEHAAYPDWKLIDVLQTEAECEHVRNFAKERASEDVFLNADPELQQLGEGECMASDDPRLKGIDLHPLMPPPPQFEKKQK